MIQIGRYNTLKIESVSTHVYTLDGGNRKLLLPRKELPNPARVGESVEVFVYNDQKESLKATTQRPHAQVGEFAVLTVKEIQPFGAFLDWGIQKDLFLPAKNQKRHYKPGEFALVYLILDFEQTGVLGTTFVEQHLSYSPTDIREGQQVSMLVIGHSKLGANVIVNNTYRGIVYQNDLLKPLVRGETVTGYIKQVREDGKLDCTIKPVGFKPAVHENQDIILKQLRRHDGVLYLHDKSSPDEIRKLLQMSKKHFKAAIGTLYREKKITIHDDHIALRS
ncbi:MAG: CvfB family protein [Spirochaetota bacterium]